MGSAELQQSMLNDMREYNSQLMQLEASAEAIDGIFLPQELAEMLQDSKKKKDYYLGIQANCVAKIEEAKAVDQGLEQLEFSLGEQFSNRLTR